MIRNLLNNHECQYSTISSRIVNLVRSSGSISTCRPAETELQGRIINGKTSLYSCFVSACTVSMNGGRRSVYTCFYVKTFVIAGSYILQANELVMMMYRWSVCDNVHCMETTKRSISVALYILETITKLNTALLHKDSVQRMHVTHAFIPFSGVAVVNSENPAAGKAKLLMLE